MIYPGCGDVVKNLPSPLYVLKFILHCLAPARLNYKTPGKLEIMTS